jgi:hypothetical protein
MPATESEAAANLEPGTGTQVAAKGGGGWRSTTPKKHCAGVRRGESEPGLWVAEKLNGGGGEPGTETNSKRAMRARLVAGRSRPFLDIDHVCKLA